MRALIVVAVTAGIIVIPLAGLLSVGSDLFTRIGSSVPPESDDEEEAYGDTSAIPGFAEERDSLLTDALR